MNRLIVAIVTCLTMAVPLPAQLRVVKGELVEGLKCRADETQTYTLYLPKSFSTDRRWPVLLIYDPRGRSVQAAEIFRSAAETHGWILISSNDTRSDGPPDPNVKALNALLPELARYPIDQNRIYMAGFSGGAMLAFVVAADNQGGVAGVIGCGGRFPDGWERKPVAFAHWGAAGSTDFNYSQMRKIDEFLEDRGRSHRFESFEGTHQWMPAELAEQAIEWMELDAMRLGLREKDESLIERVWSKDIASVEAIEGSGDPADVLHRWKAIESTFRELRDVSVASARVQQLESDKTVKRALRDHRKWDEWEERMRRQIGIAVGTLRYEERPVPIGRLTGELRLDEVDKRAAAAGYEALAAKRVRSSIYSQVSFYLPRELMAAGRYDRAALVLEVAELMNPGSWFALYNLACAWSRTGQEDRAIDALTRAIDAGFSNVELMETDDDLAAIRGNSRFAELLEKATRNAEH